MFHPATRSTALARRAVIFVIAGLCTVAPAAAASAATLTISVPAKVKSAEGYQISVQGTFRKSETASGRAYLISVIQFSPAPCKASAQAEAQTKNLQVQYYLAPHSNPRKGPVGVFEKKSPFVTKRVFTFAPTVGVRHVCSWLYPSFIHDPSVTTSPIAKADKRYRVTKG
jgi:hypothetical protein